MKSTCNDQWLGAKISFTAGFFGLLMFLLLITQSRGRAENIQLAKELTSIITGANWVMSGWTAFYVCSSFAGALAIGMGVSECLLNLRGKIITSWNMALLPLATAVFVAALHLKITLYLLQAN
jgi:hypothetical protein